MEEIERSIAEVMDLTVVCQSFPRLPEPIISRDNLIDVVERMYDGGIQLVSVEGEDGLGKTTLLAQFAKCHPLNTLSVFITPPSKLGYDPTSVRYDLCIQLLWLLGRSDSCTPEQADEGYLRNRLLELRKLARREPFYFVLDGLTDVPDEATRRIILELLPLGQRGFRFLLSGNLDELPLNANIRSRIVCKPTQMVKFSLDETQRYFQDLDLDQNIVGDLYQACGRGVPGYLASVRRSITAGEDPVDLAQTTLEDLFQAEWNQVASDESKLHVLGIIAHSQHRMNVDELARLARKDHSQVRSSLSGLTFLEINELTAEVTFVSGPFGAFAREKLQHRREGVMDLIIDDLMSRQDTDIALDYLPNYLEQRGSLDAVLECLSQGYFTKIVDQSQSLVPVRQKIDLGISAAMEAHSHQELLRFSMQKSAIAQLEKTQVWRSEVEALIALDDFTGAMNLAQSMLLKEDRLHLFAVIAKVRREQGRLVEEELLQQIQTLYEHVDVANLGDRAIDIASDLFSSHPDLAIDLVERSTWSENEDNALDMAYAKLSIAALRSRSLDDGAQVGIEDIRERIKDPELRSLSVALSSILVTRTSEEVIAEANKMESTQHRLHLLRQWTVNNRDARDAGDVVEYALDCAVADSSYSPNALVLRELAYPLPYLNDGTMVRLLVGIFDSQKATVEHLGPTEDFIRLQLLLARAEKSYSIQACRNRVIDLYLSIGIIDDPPLKASCMAWLLVTLNRVDLGDEFESKENIRSLTISDIKSEIEVLLKNTAKHFDVMQATIRALAQADPEMGLDLALRLNTEDRRDQAVMALIDALIGGSLERLSVVVLERALASFVDQDRRDRAITKIIERYSKDLNYTYSFLKDALPFINQISTIRGARQQCRASSAAHSLLCRTSEDDEHDSLKQHLLSQLSNGWHKIDAGWAKVDSGFQIVKSLAEHRVDLARQYLKETELERNQMIFSAEGTARAYMSCLALSIRAFAGLLPRNVDVEQDRVRIGELIDSLPSVGERAKLWSELAIRYFVARRTEDGRKIVTEHVKPLLSNLSNKDESYYVSIALAVSEALYTAHALTAKEIIKSLPLPDKDEALARCAAFLVQKAPLSDPHDSVGKEFDLSYETIIEIIEIINDIEHDATVYSFVKSISETMCSTRFRNRFTYQQKAEIVRRLKIIASTKFPDASNIQHEGFKIATEAQIARVDSESSAVWGRLIERARAIPNTSDSGYVIALIAAMMPNRDRNRRKSASEEAIHVVERIPSSYDRMDRLVDVASVIANVDHLEAVAYLKSAMENVVKQNGPGLRSLRGRIIDLTFRLDPDLAASLASIADDDPAKDHARFELRDRLETLQLSKKIMNNQLGSEDAASTRLKSELPRSAWMVLASLNGGRTSSLRLEETHEYLCLASDYAIGESYPIFSWVIENAVKRLSGTEQASTTLREMFEATLSACEISARMATHYSEQIKKTKSRVPQGLPENSLLISAGDREKAIKFISDWFANEAKDYVKICDPFFGPNDLELLSLIRSANPGCKVYVLTSKQYHDQLNITAPDSEYLSKWRSCSDQDPPETEIIVVGLETTGRSPIHDRWWLSNGSGLKVGTSYNSIGITQDSTISVIPAEEASLLERDVDQYIVEKRRDYNGERLRYFSFTL